MKLSQLIARAQQLLEIEGDVEVELPDGTLMHRLLPITRSVKTLEDHCARPRAHESPAGGKTK